MIVVSGQGIMVEHVKYYEEFKTLYEQCKVLSELFYGCHWELDLEKIIKNNGKRKEIIEKLQAALSCHLLDEQQVALLDDAIEFFKQYDSLDKTIKVSFIDEYSKYYTSYKDNLINQKYPEIISIERYETEYSETYLICKTNRGFKILEIDGTHIRDIETWAEAAERCENYAGQNFDNWVTRSDEPSFTEQYPEPDRSISRKLELYQIPVENYSTIDKFILGEIWDAFCTVTTKDAGFRCDAAAEILMREIA